MGINLQHLKNLFWRKNVYKISPYFSVPEVHHRDGANSQGYSSLPQLTSRLEELDYL
jgi:hypothetical protein